MNAQQPQPRPMVAQLIGNLVSVDLNFGNVMHVGKLVAAEMNASGIAALGLGPNDEFFSIIKLIRVGAEDTVIIRVLTEARYNILLEQPGNQ